MKLRGISIALLLCLLACALCACGAKKADDTFTVDYVATAGVAKPVVLIVGQHQGKTIKMDAGSFKDCTLTSVEYIGETATLSGTEDGYLKIDDGVIVKVNDANGVEHSIEVKEGTVFTLDTSVDGAWRILLPETAA